MTATNPYLDQNRARWTRQQIRAARIAPLAPLLQQHGLTLCELANGNFELAAYKGLLIKDSYWRWPQRDLAGNAIDFFVKILGLSFNDAMRQISPLSESNIDR